MKLLLVDDEIVTIRGILKGVDWEQVFFEKVLTATDAAEAKELLLTERPEIMLCDIEMPGESGLKLLEWVREQKLRTECMFLTCHEEFDFARRAMKLKGMDYLLKPIPYDELTDILIKAAETVREQEQKHRYQEYGKQQLNGLKEQVLSDEENIPDAKKVVETIKKYIWEHFEEELTVEKLARQVFISADYLYRIFKKYENMTPVEYMTNAKMLYASEILKQPGISISHAAVLSGYSNYCYFTKVFKKYHGMTPSRYKQAYGEKTEVDINGSVSESKGGMDRGRSERV